VNAELGPPPAPSGPPEALPQTPPGPRPWASCKHMSNTGAHGQCRGCRSPWTACGHPLPEGRFACPQPDHRSLGQRFALTHSPLDNPSLRSGLTTLPTGSTTTR